MLLLQYTPRSVSKYYFSILVKYKNLYVYTANSGTKFVVRFTEVKCNQNLVSVQLLRKEYLEENTKRSNGTGQGKRMVHN